MSASETQPTRARTPKEAIAEADRILLEAGVAPYSDIERDRVLFQQLAALRFGQVWRLTYAASAASLNLQAGTPGGVEEALELTASAASRGVAYLAEADARLDLRDPPENVVLFAAHRIQVAGGRL